MHLMIENKGEAPLESYTLLGATTARGDKNLIGQFGSGNKHAINVCLRAGLMPVVFSGEKKIEFFTKPHSFQGKAIQKVCASVNGVAQELGFCTEFGELDWDGVGMGLREFVSNAIDASGGDFADILVDMTGAEPSGEAGCTRVFVEANQDVKKYYGELNRHFLHFDGKQKDGILKKEDRSTNARIYRMGVFVRDVDGRTPSLFDYNFGDELEIDECRNLDNHKAQMEAAALLSRSEHLEEVFGCLVRDDTKWWEIQRFNSWYLGGTTNSWCKQWRAAAGDAIIASPTYGPMIRKVEEKGFTVKLITNNAWYEAMVDKGIPCIKDHLHSVETKGQEVIDTSNKCLNSVAVVWSWIEMVGMSEGKTMPKVKMFQKIMDSGTVLGGYFDPKVPDTIFLNKSHQDNKQTILEELAHYITRATDNSRDFQDYAFKIAIEFAEADLE